MAVPKIIWIFWLQGFENAPPLVQSCVKSWVKHNPDWTLRLVTETNMRDYLDPAFCDAIIAANLPFRKISNVVRLSLIAAHGGVYADADCFCTQPLNDWIHKAAEPGFFAFRFLESDQWFNDPAVPFWKRPFTKTKDRTLANWFIAGTPGNEITKRIATPHFELLARAKKSRKWYGRSVSQRIYKSMRRNAYMASLTGNPAFIDRVGSYPFYVMHYHFAHLIRTDPVFKEVWSRVERRSADDALTYRQTLGLPVDQDFQDAIAGARSPVYKLQFRTAASQPDEAVSRYDWLQDKMSANPVPY